MHKNHKYTRGVISTLLCILLIASQNSVYALEAAKEYEIKAAFLYNLAQFVTWPKESLAEADMPFNLCILGEDPFKDSIDLLMEGEKIDGHSMLALRINEIEQAEPCQILFISSSKKQDLKKIFDALGNMRKAILSVGDVDGFVAQGGMVEFFILNNKVRLSLSPQLIDETGLKASAHLLRISQKRENK